MSLLVSLSLFQGIDDREKTNFFTDVTAARALGYCSSWRELSGEAYEVSVKLQTFIDRGISLTCGSFHPGCYRKFTNKVLLERAKKRPLSVSREQCPQKKKVRQTRGATTGDISKFPRKNNRVWPLVHHLSA